MNATTEGVATEEQVAALVDLGCDQVQRFLLGSPFDAQAIAGAFA